MYCSQPPEGQHDVLYETTPGQQVVGSDYTKDDMFRATGPSATWIQMYFLPLTSERQYSYSDPQAQVLERIIQTKFF